MSAGGAGTVDRALRSVARAPVGPEAARAAEAFAERARRDGLADVAYSFADTPFGKMLIATTTRGLVRVAFRPEPVDRVLDELAARVSPRVLESARGTGDVRRELDEYFAGRRRRFDLPLDWTLTRGFSQRVLRATAKIPYGGVSTYRDVAARAGNPRAMRAAGNALGSNPIPIVVPCHRVLRTGGGLGGYGGGLAMKERLLRLEGALLG